MGGGAREALRPGNFGGGVMERKWEEFRVPIVGGSRTEKKKKGQQTGGKPETKCASAAIRATSAYTAVAL